MTAQANKVKFGLKNVHYAKITDDGSVITYEKPVHIRGAVNLSLSANGEIVEFAADDATYFSSEVNNGYDGDLEIADLPEEFETEILGSEKINGVVYEKSSQKGSKFAILFEVDGDQHKRRYVYYYCSATRPNVEASTKAGTSIEPKTSSLTFQARPHIYTEDVKAYTTKDVSKEMFDAWFNEVHTRPAPEETE